MSNVSPQEQDAAKTLLRTVQIAHLRGLVEAGKIAAKDQDFVKSLLAQYEKKGSLSDKQWYWVDKMAKDADGDKPEVADKTHAAAAIWDLFAKNKALQWPTIEVLLVPAASAPVWMHLTRHPKKEVITVKVCLATKEGETWHVPQKYEFAWAGSISSTEMTWSFKLDPNVKSHGKWALEMFNNDPQGHAAASGKLTGRCCFCRSKLEDPKSTEVGYGPHCAKVWGMDWGKKATGKKDPYKFIKPSPFGMIKKIEKDAVLFGLVTAEYDHGTKMMHFVVKDNEWAGILIQELNLHGFTNYEFGVVVG